MNHAQAKQAANCTLLWWFMRGFWTCLAAVHLSPFASLVVKFFTAPSVSVGFWLAVVVGVIGVFALKAADFSMLRFRRPGLEFTAFVVVTALIHGDAVTGRNSPALAVETTTAVVVASGGVLVGSRRLRQGFAQLLRGLAARLSLTHNRRWIGMVRLAAGLRGDQIWCRCIAARAPPLLVL